MNYEEVLADLFECEIKSIVEADEIDEGKESDALLAREAARPLLAELEDEPLYVAETGDGEHVVAGARQAFLIGPDGTYAKSLDGSEPEIEEEDEDLDEKCKTKSGKKAKKKMTKEEYEALPDEDCFSIEDENYVRLETGDLLLVEVGQEHSCHGCSKFGSNHPSCADSVAVGKKYGGDKLNLWLKDSMKTNTCSFFKGLAEALEEDMAVAESPPVAEGLSVDYGSVVIRLNKYDLIKYPMREPGESDKSHTAEAQEASEDALIMAAIAAKPAFMKAVRENLKANPSLSKFGLTIRESEDMAALETALVEEVTGRIAAGGGSKAVPKSVIDEMNWFDVAHKELDYETAVEHAENIIEALDLDESLIPIPSIGKNPKTPHDTGPGAKGKGKSASGPKLDSIEGEEDEEDLEEVRGAGRGVGGGRQGDGGAATCVCPKCGEKIAHERGTPCMETTCPKCGAKMVGESEEDPNSDFSPAGLGEAIPGKARYWVYKFDAAENKGVRVGADNNLKKALAELKKDKTGNGWVFDRQTKQKLGPKGNVIEALQKFSMKPCPICGSKVPTNTGYCMKCKKKTLKTESVDEATFEKGRRVAWTAPNGTKMQGVVVNDVGGKYDIKVRVTNPTPKRGDEEVLVKRAKLKTAGPAEDLDEDKTSKEMEAGLKGFVADYILSRSHGNVSLAKQIKKKIDAIIKKKGLKKDKVYGYFGDPDDPKQREKVRKAARNLKESELAEVAGGMTMTMKGREIKEPTFMKKLANKAGVELKRALRLWGKAQFATEDQYPEIKKKSSRYYEIVTGIFKKMLRLKEDVDLKAWLAGLSNADWRGIIEQEPPTNGEPPANGEEPDDDDDDEPKAKPKPKTTVAVASGKKGKSAVNYQPQSGTKKCKTCSFWLGGQCSQVKGKISPDGTCDLHQKKVKTESNNLLVRFSITESDHKLVKKFMDLATGVGLDYETPVHLRGGKLEFDVPEALGRKIKPFMEGVGVSAEVLQE